MSRVCCGGSIAELDFVIAADRNAAAVVSYYSRSLSTVKSIAAYCGMEKSALTVENVHDEEGNIRNVEFISSSSYAGYFLPVIRGKEKFYHGLLISDELNKSMILMEKGKEAEVLYNHLMGAYELPLKKEWASALYNWFLENNKIESQKLFFKGENSIKDFIPCNGRMLPLSQLYAVKVTADEVVLKDAVQELFAKKAICISNKPQNPLSFKDMDEYFSRYGTTMVSNLEKQMDPLVPLDGEAHDFTLKGKRLYPQQIAQLNGIVKRCENSRFAIVNHGMGTGKTVLSAAVAESYFTRKWLRSHPHATLADAYEKKGNVTYRNVVMCPPHLVEKWAEEIRSEVPYARVEILRDFKQLVSLRARGAKRRGKEWYVLSKDFCKMSFQHEPIPKTRRVMRVKGKVCNDCGEEMIFPGSKCSKCGSTNLRYVDTPFIEHGMVCPHCKNLLVSYCSQPSLVSDYEGDSMPKVLDHDSFTNESRANSRCFYCDSELWQPHVANLGDSGKKNVWVRATHYANKAHKGKKRVWVHRKFMDDYFDLIHEKPLNIMWNNNGVRRYAPSLFFKKYLKGYFDMAFFDEAHCYKGGDTGQGHAMHALIKASKKAVALTGTILNGKADSIYYLLWRLNPKRMQQMGFKYSEVMAFAEKYGKIDREFEYCDTVEGEYKVSCKGKQISSGNIKPGISPLVFTDFLLDCTTFLDLSDMSKYLPPLKETVVLCKREDTDEQNMERDYKSVIDDLCKASKTKEGGGRAILSTMLQFSLSFLDKPYGYGDIKSPKDGTVIVKTPEYPQFSSLDRLMAKEKKLIEIVKSELSQDRNCFVFAEYTASAETCVSARLKAILERYCNLQGKVAILESSSPAASEREAWMHKKAAEGIKVFITNPRCVETGLDFCFNEAGKFYNYPTIVFYQMGYKLFTVWQSSRRHYRLNQTKECRTYYMAYQGTVQQQVLALIAEKQSATSAIQGKFSTEGLSAVANGTDVRVELAKSLSEQDSTSGSDLQGMFDVLAQDSDSSYDQYKQMLLFKEVISGLESKEETFDSGKMQEIAAMSMLDLFDFNAVLSAQQELSQETVDDDIVAEFIVDSIENMPQKKRSGRCKVMAGQLSLF